MSKPFPDTTSNTNVPEIRNVSTKVRIKIHQEYYKTILHRDVIERFDAIHPQAVMRAGYRLISTAGSLYSINRITSYLKSTGSKISKGKEIDFVWLDGQGTKHLIQVCFSLHDTSTRKREISSLFQAMDELNLKESIIVSLEQDDILEKEGKKINIIPAWKYLVMN